MHHALLIPDILDRIFAFANVDNERTRTFSALARTCSALSEVSLDALWSELESLYPLVSCIYKTNMKLFNEHTTGADDDAELDMSVFHKYAYRVRKLFLFGLHDAAVVEDLGMFQALQVPSPLLPNLTDLVWNDELGLSLVWPLLNPRLRSLQIPISHWITGSTPLLLSKIRGLCPELRSLTLRISFGLVQGGPGEQALAGNCLSRVICSWKKLEELDYSPLGCEGITSLCALSSLKVLRLHIDDSFLGLPANSLSFPSLRSVHVKAQNLGSIFPLLQAMKTFPKSIRIDLPIGLFGNVNYGLETVELILSLISQHEIERFSMSFPGNPNPVNVSEMLRPLFRCCNLRALQVAVMSQFTLLDDDLCTIASAWPQLEELELFDLPPPCRVPFPSQLADGQDFPPVPEFELLPVPQPLPVPQFPPVPQPLPVPQPVHPYSLISAEVSYPELIYSWFPHARRTAEITFHGFITLLRLCPNLRFFNLAIDATKLDGLQGDKPGGGVCNRLIKHVNFIDSPIGDPEAVACILLDILPELKTVLGSHTPPYTQLLPAGWIQVQQRILAARETTGAELAT
ncbi:hypothetical protein K503DRAFT_770511 [Rhizopogon vinicolor AM-OR11-026]|uniref:F-box domain-containing protein n=1 Tax=Rhizopogon vinicolor AM-OR11-026 TaxID=1314800 RepID=A0A1B7N0M3_9AGAM|nr:hypothetical protein K503DRAFT_770511 [Rhizopogon vinicolor AM-OR11-026]